MKKRADEEFDLIVLTDVRTEIAEAFISFKIDTAREAATNKWKSVERSMQ